MNLKSILAVLTIICILVFANAGIAKIAKADCLEKTPTSEQSVVVKRSISPFARPFIDTGFAQVWNPRFRPDARFDLEFYPRYRYQYHQPFNRYRAQPLRDYPRRDFNFFCDYLW